jgi:hypothetical protein
MLAAPRAKAIRESEKVLFIDLIEDGGVFDYAGLSRNSR